MAEVAPLADGQQADHHPALSAGPTADDEQLDRVAQAAALGEPAPERIGDTQEAVKEREEPAPERAGHHSGHAAGVGLGGGRRGLDASPLPSASRTFRERLAQGIALEAGHSGSFGEAAQLRPSHGWRTLLQSR